MMISYQYDNEFNKIISNNSHSVLFSQYENELIRLQAFFGCKNVGDLRKLIMDKINETTQQYEYINFIDYRQTNQFKGYPHMFDDITHKLNMFCSLDDVFHEIKYHHLHIVKETTDKKFYVMYKYNEKIIMKKIIFDNYQPTIQESDISITELLIKHKKLILEMRGIFKLNELMETFKFD